MKMVSNWIMIGFIYKVCLPVLCRAKCRQRLCLKSQKNTFKYLNNIWWFCNRKSLVHFPSIQESSIHRFSADSVMVRALKEPLESLGLGPQRGTLDESTEY